MVQTRNVLRLGERIIHKEPTELYTKSLLGQEMKNEKCKKELCLMWFGNEMWFLFYCCKFMIAHCMRLFPPNSWLGGTFLLSRVNVWVRGYTSVGAGIDSFRQWEWYFSVGLFYFKSGERNHVANSRECDFRECVMYHASIAVLVKTKQIIVLQSSSWLQSIQSVGVGSLSVSKENIIKPMVQLHERGINLWCCATSF